MEQIYGDDGRLTPTVAMERRHALQREIGLLRLSEREQALVDMAVRQAKLEIVESLIRLELI